MKKIDLKAKWVWGKDNKKSNQIVVFRYSFSLDNIPKVCDTYISVDTKYWLYINGKLAVFEGGLFRESLPGCGYADSVDIASYLTLGENEIQVLCWFYGNEGRNNKNSTQAGFILECEAIGVYSSREFEVASHPAYGDSCGQMPSYLYGGHNIAFDARKKLDESCFESATEYENEAWGDLYKRPIPLHRIGEKVELEAVQCSDHRVSCKLPYAMQISPCFEVEALGGEVINIYTDRYKTNGGPGDEKNEYFGHRIQYTCEKGLNCFESPFYLFGQTIILEMDKKVELKQVAYRESGYDCDIVGEFKCDCELTNKLVKKATRTLYVCMRDNFMDCPDRERGQWIGDVSVQIPQVAFLLDDRAKLLARKSIQDFINLRRGDVLVGNVPGANSAELPAQSLNAISCLGLVAQYYKYTGDEEILDFVFEPSMNYLKLWTMAEDGMVNHRNGDWSWFDHLHNVDEDVLENSWYYSALKFMSFIAEKTGRNEWNDFLEARMESIRQGFDKKFWKGEFYSSSGVVDDRANAMAVLSGLCSKEKYPSIRKILLSVFNATVYMENYVLMALAEMGYVEDCYKRMRARYYNLAVNEDSTLWEDFYILGTHNHAWSGAPAVVAFKYFAGIETNDGFKTVSIKPNTEIFKTMNFTFPGKKGLIHVKVDNIKGEVAIDNQSESEIRG